MKDSKGFKIDQTIFLTWQLNTDTLKMLKDCAHEILLYLKSKIQDVSRKKIVKIAKHS